MKIEYEVRMLNVDLQSMIEEVQKIGAIKIESYLQRRYVYDFVPVQKGRWIRLRTNGIESTLAIKEIKSLKIDGTRELEIKVSSFEGTNKILEKLGYFPRNYQENYRIEYNLNDVVFDFDKWPSIPPYLEIEGKTEQSVLSAMEKLKIQENQVTTMNIENIYRTYYQIELDSIQSLKFSDEEKKIIALFESEE